MNRALMMVALAALVACKHQPREPGGRYRAVGTFVHDGLGAADAIGWATEVEILQSNVLFDAVARELRERGHPGSLEAARRGITARRRADSRVIEVAVRFDDRLLAQEICNLLIEQYIYRRFEGQQEARAVQEKALAQEVDELRAQLDKDGGVPNLEELYEKKLSRLSEMQLERGSYHYDVRTLDSCRVEGQQAE